MNRDRQIQSPSSPPVVLLPILPPSTIHPRVEYASDWQEDVDVPVDCGYAVFRALKTKGVPTKLSVYPREPHGISERSHLVDMTTKTTAWLQTYLPTQASGSSGAAARTAKL